jgi:hypothetical protein
VKHLNLIWYFAPKFFHVYEQVHNKLW